MEVIILSFGVMALVVAGMAIGVISGREPIKGSCGGLGAVGIDGECEICGGNPAKCDSDKPASKVSALAYDAGKAAAVQAKSN